MPNKRKKKKQCPYNGWVYCKDKSCDGCGWYPKEKQELEKIEEKKEAQNKQ